MSHRVAKLLLALVVVAFFAPLLLRGEVLFAHDNRIEVGLPPASAGGPTSNRKFNDQSSVYVPEIHHHLNGRHAGWISTWNPHVECGRPTTQVAGFGKAFLLTHLFSFFTDDALVMATWQAIAAAALTALFGYLLCAALRLRPEACLVGALGIGLGVFHAYWLTFPLFLWTVCWSLAILWLVVRFVERGGLPALGGLAFAVHALLLSGYPQLVLWNGYLITGFVLWRVARAPASPGASGTPLRRLAWLAAAAAVGVVSVLPVYADVALTASRSARLTADTAFFLEVLPKVHDWRDLARFLLLRFDPFWLGNPIEPGFPLRYNGLSMTPLFAALAATTLRPRLIRRLWPVQLFVAGTLVMTLWPAAYAFGVEHLGLHVSRTNPLAAAIVPGMLLAAYGAHALLVAEGRALAAPCIVLVVAALAAASAWSLETPLAPGFTTTGFVLLAGTLLFAWLRRSLLLVALVVITCFHYAGRLPLARPPEDVQRSSPLVEMVQRGTDGGRLRFAWVAGGGGLVLPPNQEAFLGLRSIHSYNSLSSRAYQDWVLRLSTEGTQTYGRHFHQIVSEERLAGHELELSGIGLLVSGVPLHTEGLEQVVRNPQGGGVYRTTEPRLEAQVGRFTVEEGGAHIAGSLAAATNGVVPPVHRILDQDDRLHFELQASSDPTLLFVSQQFHPQWVATADGKALETLPVNDFYQGVLVPAGTSSVELHFLPWVRWAWIPQALFALAGAAWGLVYFLRKSAWFGGSSGVAMRT